MVRILQQMSKAMTMSEALLEVPMVTYLIRMQQEMLSVMSNILLQVTITWEA